MQERRETTMIQQAEKKYKERKLDQEFANRLKDIDLVEENTDTSSGSESDK